MSESLPYCGGTSVEIKHNTSEIRQDFNHNKAKNMNIKTCHSAKIMSEISY